MMEIGQIFATISLYLFLFPSCKTVKDLETSEHLLCAGTGQKKPDNKRP